MRVTSATVRYECSQCGHEYDVDVTFGCAAQLYGPPESCYPSEPDEVENPECPECGAIACCETVIEMAADLVQSWEEDRWELEVDR